MNLYDSPINSIDPIEQKRNAHLRLSFDKFHTGEVGRNRCSLGINRLVHLDVCSFFGKWLYSDWHVG